MRDLAFQPWAHDCLGAGSGETSSSVGLAGLVAGRATVVTLLDRGHQVDTFYRGLPPARPWLGLYLLPESDSDDDEQDGPENAAEKLLSFPS